MQDLRNRGLLRDTLVVVGTEFGRTPVVNLGGFRSVHNGRDHNIFGFTVLLAGAGVKAGLAYGKTPRGDRIYVANNLGGVAGATNPPGRTVTVIDPKTNHVVNTIDLGLALQPYGVAFGRTGRTSPTIGIARLRSAQR